MTRNNAIEGAISTLANTMRLYVEAQMRFGSLFKIDREEAINNLDRAFEAKLEAFHTLYDVSKGLFPFFDHGDSTFLIAMRNAIHHRDHPLFCSLFSRLFLEGIPSRWLGASFLLATYPTLHGAPIFMRHYFRLDDFYARFDPNLASPHLDTSLRGDKAEQRFKLIDRQLGLAVIRQKGASERYPGDQIYLDVVPIFTSAVCRVFKVMKGAGIAFRGYDAEVYRDPFTSEIEVDLNNPIFTVSRIGL
ncbi:hypothetical protein AB8A31_07595 [Tardiphaga sp. 804_B3_N1_9]|uniref:hypothetical protein n=1 Tax=Tardiphaga TaxID=1395974 RepID=UPI001585D88D|nr:hypothetical protein [Tardiphaga robiniae]NUU40573.1 hypothetical protein [Tardiphaga robiniae]